MTDEDGVILSVRGEAEVTVAPDSVALASGIVMWRDSKPDALSAAAAALGRFTADLSELGGVPLAVGTKRSTVTWSAFSATTRAEREHDKQTGRSELTGRVLATVGVAVTVRDFALLEALGRVLARHEELNVRNVTWEVDDDNPGWATVRTEAIQAGLRRGRDYAAALGVSLLWVEHVADTGLLGGTGENPRRVRAAALVATGGGHDANDVDTPSLDPVPQQLSAVIEVRLRATRADLSV